MRQWKTFYVDKKVAPSVEIMSVDAQSDGASGGEIASADAQSYGTCRGDHVSH
jgi:hypothetical protein